MTNRSFQKSTTILLPSGAESLRLHDYSLNSGNSLKVNGKLQLRSNVLTYKNDRITGFTIVPGGVSGSIAFAPQAADATRWNQLPPSFSFAPTDSQSLARFNGKLRYGGASLGITLATWRQSRDMIHKRMRTAKQFLDREYMRISKDKRLLRRLRRNPDPLANQVLETEFGWKPLIQDVHAALFTAAKHAIPDQFMRAVGKSHWQEDEVLGPHFKQHWEGHSQTTYCSRVAISNENLWMLNRLGLINPASVAFDAIPWSFLLSMVSNVNAFINSFTEEVGLTFTDRSVTRSVKMLTTQWQRGVSFNPVPETRTVLLWKYKNRALDVKPDLSWQWKIPDLNWELAAIAASLVVQRFDRINRLIRVVV